MNKVMRFHERVSIERSVITLVNNNFSYSKPLTGLSIPTITTWESDSNKYYKKNLVSKVVGILRKLSLCLQYLSSVSTVVFEDKLIVDKEEIHQNMSELQSAVRDIEKI